MPPLKHQALTKRYTYLSTVVQTDVLVALPSLNSKKQPTHKFIGIWDTGATNTMITKSVVMALGLHPIDIQKVLTAAGEHDANRYLIDIFLPSRVVIEDVSVLECILTPGSDILIGMDIISLGDFAITNAKGKTTMSFRTPSIKEIDFIPESNKHNLKMNRLALQHTSRAKIHAKRRQERKNKKTSKKHH